MSFETKIYTWLYGNFVSSDEFGNRYYCNSKNYKSKIAKTPIGSVSEPIFLPKGILIFKVRDKRKIKRNIEEEKNLLVNAEKTKILRMYSLSHYDKLERSISVKFLND